MKVNFLQKKFFIFSYKIHSAYAAVTYSHLYGGDYVVYFILLFMNGSGGFVAAESIRKFNFIFFIESKIKIILFILRNTAIKMMCTNDTYFKKKEEERNEDPCE